jgi:hypothetical protein
MSHYAKVLDGKVSQVIVAEAEFFKTFIDTSPGEWIQTSYNTVANTHTQGGTPLRGNYAGIGYTYDHVNDVFIQPKPYPSWVLTSSWIWNAPTPYPTDGKSYGWDEPTLSWVLLPIPNTVS